MIIFPAVDIQNGKAVRLKRGKKNDATIFDDNPLEMARKWQSQGARWLHIVDLDGAFDGNLANADIIGAIAREAHIPVQAGGGIRTVEAARKYLDAGVTRVIIGTAALEDTEIFKNMCQTFPGRIGVSLDGENGILKTKGWVSSTNMTIQDIVPRLEAAGASFFIYTDINNDGMQSGINPEAFRVLLQATRLPVIAAGGVASLKDVKEAWNLRQYGNMQGLITGRAIYEGTLNLQSAQDWLDKASQSSR